MTEAQADLMIAELQAIRQLMDLVIQPATVTMIILGIALAILFFNVAARARNNARWW